MILRSVTWPVSVSTSTTARWAPNGKVGCGALKSLSPDQWLTVGGGDVCPADGRRRRAGDVERAGVGVEHHVFDGGLEQVGCPFDEQRRRASPAAITIDEPATCTERDPTVSPPDGTSSVSPWTTSTASIGTPRRSAMIIFHVVTCPCPYGVAPVNTRSRPSANSCTAPYSVGAAADVIST